MKIVEPFFAVGCSLAVAHSGISDDSTPVYFQQIDTFLVSQRPNEIRRRALQIVEEIHFDAARIHGKFRAKVVSQEHRIAMYDRRAVKIGKPYGVEIVANLSH